MALYDLGRYEEAIEALRGAFLRDSWGFAWLAAANAHLGRIDEARSALSEFVSIRTEELEMIGMVADTSASLLGNYRKNFRHEQQWDHFIDGLRKAGLPE